MIGIIGAMEEEISKLKEIMNNKEIKTIAGMEFVKGEISKKQVTFRYRQGKCCSLHTDTDRQIQSRCGYQYRHCRFIKK